MTRGKRRLAEEWRRCAREVFRKWRIKGYARLGFELATLRGEEKSERPGFFDDSLLDWWVRRQSLRQCLLVQWCEISGFGDSLLDLEMSYVVSRFLVDPLSVDSIEGHNRVSGKGFPTTGPRIEVGNVVVHRRLHVTRPLVVACVLSGIRSYLLVDPDAGCSCTLRICASCGITRLICASFGSTRLICASFGSTRLICASFGSTRLICASFGSTRLICASFGITRLIGVSFGITRLICAFYGTTRLLCRVRAQRGADRREAGRTREGHMDASGFLITSADVFC
ncbi:hypothetical protein E6C27_scaffold455G00490 [Cucumis melo var. makuwa]|uniref:DNA-directed RNA polymerase I subunit RPA1-like n=1 Tax=Cucumis melo var. makuwa TaxID=1194695 RepID=A0A5A7V682_CUCMM|nr:hypothetical protein E6C27_scaffold455G00490 [Cucumis melo var. makuwa]